MINQTMWPGLLLPIVGLARRWRVLVLVHAFLWLGCAGPTSLSGQSSSSVEVLDAAQVQLLSKSPTQASCKSVQKPQVDFTKPVGEKQLVDWAMHYAPTLGVARMQVKRAQSEKLRSQYWTPYNPNIQTEFGARSLPGDVGLDVGVSIQQQFEVGGQRALRRDAAQASIAWSQARLDESCLSLRVEIKKAIALAQLSQKRSDLMALLIQLYEQSYALAQKRVKAGQDASSALLALKVDLAQLKQQLLIAQGEFKLQVSQIKQLVGLPPTRQLILEGNVRLQQGDNMPALKDLIKRALVHNKMLRSQALLVSRAKAESTLQDKEGWVDPAVGLSYGREGGREPAHVFMLSLSLDIPLFDKNQEKIAAAQADVLIQRARLGQLAQTIRAQINQEHTRYKAAMRQLNVYSQTIKPTLKQDMKNVQAAFVSGELGISKLVQVQKRIFIIELSNLDAQRQMILARVEIERLIGGEVQ